MGVQGKCDSGSYIEAATFVQENVLFLILPGQGYRSFEGDTCMVEAGRWM